MSHTDANCNRYDNSRSSVLSSPYSSSYSGSSFTLEEPFRFSNTLAPAQLIKEPIDIATTSDKDPPATDNVRKHRPDMLVCL